ncbi:hypothetical protein EC23916_A0341 [Escherichia coli 2.3916]|nr:hypothetical protein EC23916_A0341 [Escherichia coli 2.3916]
MDLSLRSPESLSAASFDTTMVKPCEIEKIAQNAIQRVLEGIYKTVVALIDRNLNPKKIKKTPKNGCLFNTACVP